MPIGRINNINQILEILDFKQVDLQKRQPVADPALRHLIEREVKPRQQRAINVVGFQSLRDKTAVDA